MLSCWWDATNIRFYQSHFTLLTRHPRYKNHCCITVVALQSSHLFQKANCWCALLSAGEAPVIVHYFITLQPAATGCVTCFSLLICSARYSFSALLHLIRTSCVPPNNGIMAGTCWLCWCWVPPGQAPEPWSGNLSLHKCGTVTSARVCWCLLGIRITSSGLETCWCFNC